MQRQTELKNWLQTVYPERDFDLSFAAADADFRRYFRAAFSDGGSVVCMDAPPDKMSVAPYLNCLTWSMCRRYCTRTRIWGLWY